MKQKVSDYIVKRLPELTGSNHCFTLVGGSAIHLVDSLGRSKKITLVPMHHEQAAVIAADAFGRVKNTIGLALVTSGPGGTNAVTGVAGAYLESTPLLVISGQVSRPTLRANTGVRQLGFQEIDIISIVKSITKYATIILNPKEVRYHLEKAVFLAKSGRPGPVWLDIPLDVQSAQIDPAKLKPFSPYELPPITESKEQTDKKIKTLVKWIEQSRRPLLLGGHGIWLAGAKKDFRQLAEALGMPVQTSWNGIDLIEEDYPLYFGRHNVYGPRYPSFIVQNCDLLISIGCRLGIQQTGMNYQSYARGAKKAVVDVDKHELYKPAVKADLPFQADAKYFIHRLLKEIKSKSFKNPQVANWLDWCQQRKRRYPVVEKDHLQDRGYVNAYVFINALSDLLPPGTLIIPGSSGTCFTVTGQTFKVKRGQRLFNSKGLAAMGYGLPSSIGGCFANGKKEVVTIIGDGGFQLNIQDLQTVVHHRLPIKFFVLSNKGYLAIRITQNSLFKGPFFGSSVEGGMSLPGFQKIAKAYGITYVKIAQPENLKSQIRKVLAQKGPLICEVMMNPDKPLLPKLSVYQKPDGSLESRPLEDMTPLLPREELKENMLIDLWPGTEDEPPKNQ